MLTGNKCSEERKFKVQVCLSSYLYYDSLQAQISCIVTSLLKGLFFLDGNKRTAFAIYLASGQGSVEENAKVLFPE